MNAVEDELDPDPGIDPGNIMLCSAERPSRAKSTSDKVQSVERVVRIGVDSGAGVSVWPRDLCKDYPTKPTEASKQGEKYAAAGVGSAAIFNEGERRIAFDVDGNRWGVRMQVAAVRKPLLAVSEMCDAGHDVHFLSTGEAYAVHRETGEITEFVRQKGVYEITAHVLPYSGGDGQPQA